MAAAVNHRLLMIRYASPFHDLEQRQKNKFTAFYRMEELFTGYAKEEVKNLNEGSLAVEAMELFDQRRMLRRRDLAIEEPTRLAERQGLSRLFVRWKRERLTDDDATDTLDWVNAYYDRQGEIMAKLKRLHEERYEGLPKPPPPDTMNGRD